MLNRNFMIVNRLGLHARAAAQFVQTASKFSAEVTLTKDDVEVNGKSIMGILLLAAPKGTEVSVAVDGDDEEQAMTVIADLIEDGFGED
jgi:phosphocarrier protein HPr